MSERYHPNADQVAFAGSISKSLESILPLARLHQAQHESEAAWAALRELGVLDVCTPEALGGSELGATEEGLIALELGRRVVTPAVLATLGAVHLGDGHVPNLGQRRVAAGYRQHGRVVVIAEKGAALLLVREAAGAALHNYPRATRPLEAQLWSSSLHEVDEATELGEPLGRASLAQLLRLRLIDAAALAGIARAALEMAVAYAALREQFGRAIGSFQAIKHHCANMALGARCASDQLSFAAVALDDARNDAPLQVESALYVAAAAAMDNCAKNIQIHGGMGFSDEAHPQRLLKRARLLVEMAGGLEAALTRVADCPPSLPKTHTTEVSRHANRS